MYYLICVILSIVLSLIYVAIWQKRFSPHLSIMYMLLPIVNVGYWQLADGTTIEQVLLANKITYLGGCFATLLFTLNIFSLCKINLKKIHKFSLFLFSTFIYCGVLTTGYDTCFYKSATLEYVDEKYVFVKEYGPIHSLFYAMIIFYFILGILALIYAIRKRNEISTINVVLMIFLVAANMGGFFGGRVHGLELMPAGYVVVQLILLIISTRLWLYEIDEMAIETINRNGYIGVISVSLNNVYLGSNTIARKMYPAINHVKVDSKIKKSDPGLEELRNWIKEVRSKGHMDDRIYQIDENSYKVSGNYLFDGKKKKGYTFIIVDWSKEQKDQESLLHMSMSDSMTGLYNKRAYSDEIEEIKENGLDKDLCIVAVDLNNLKKTNDTYGHSVGDELIEGAANCLDHGFADIGNVYRTGGDEFMIIAHCSQQKLKKAQDKLSEGIAKWNQNHDIELSLSIGYASVYEFHYYEIEDLEHVADERMYKDKNEYYRRNGIERRKF